MCRSDSVVSEHALFAIPPVGACSSVVATDACVCSSIAAYDFLHSNNGLMFAASASIVVCIITSMSNPEARINPADSHTCRTHHSFDSFDSFDIFRKGSPEFMNPVPRFVHYPISSKILLNPLFVKPSHDFFMLSVDLPQVNGKPS